MGLVESIADTYLKMGDAIAQGKLRQGQIWGQTFNTLGQIPGQVLQEQAQQKNQAQEQQIKGQQIQMGQAQLSGLQRTLAGQAAANQIVAALPKNDDGTFDTASMLPKFADANVPIEDQNRLITAFDGVNKVLTQHKNDVRNNQADLANTILNAHTADESVTPQSVQLGLAAAQAGGLATPAQVQQLNQALADGHDPEQMLKMIRGAGDKYNAPPKFSAAPPGSQPMNEQTGALVGQPVAANQPKTEAELAADAATLGTPKETPTAKSSTAAFAALRAPTPAQTETARHNLADESTARARLQLDQGAALTTGANVPDVPAGQLNTAFLQTLPASQSALVQALAEGRQAFPVGSALRSPYWQNLLEAVGKYDPGFDTVNYNARSKTRADFTSGTSAKQVNAINTVIGHLSSLDDAANALNNGDVRMFNAIGNYISKATGAPAVTNFDTVKKAVSDEVTRVWRQTGGSEKDIDAAQQNLDSSNSPAQLHQAIATYGDLLESKLSALQEQYRQGMGTDPVSLVTPQSRATLDRLEQAAGKTPTRETGATPTLTGLARGQGRTFSAGPFSGQTWTIGADGQPQRVK